MSEADQPSPENTKFPTEALREHDQARILCLAPDVCYVLVGSQKVPTPFNIYALGNESERTVETVRFRGKKAFTLRSRTTTCHGDKPGTGKGVVSGTVEGVCEPIAGSPTVRIAGAQLLRHGDMFHMNNRNTVGKLQYVIDTATYETPDTYQLNAIS